MNTKIIEKILQVAVNAPSGDNAQPWRFKFTDDTLSLYMVSGADPTLYNFEERGSYFSCGALIENIDVVAQAQGYRTTIVLLPNQNDSTHIADFSFGREKGHSRGTELTTLAEAVLARSTNRKPYAVKPLEDADREALHAVQTGEKVMFTLIEDRQRIGNISEALSVNERLILTHRKIHDTLFSFIRWSSKEEERDPHGLYIKTLELNPVQRFMFRLFARWGLVVYLERLLGISRLLSKQSAALYEKTSAFGVVSVFDTAPKSFILAGRFFERMWLVGTVRNLQIHPVTALPYLFQRITETDTKVFSKAQQEDIRTQHVVLKESAELSGEIVAMIFRIGYGTAPSAHSQKAPPQIMFE